LVLGGGREGGGLRKEEQRQSDAETVENGASAPQKKLISADWGKF